MQANRAKVLVVSAKGYALSFTADLMPPLHRLLSLSGLLTPAIWGYSKK